MAVLGAATGAGEVGEVGEVAGGAEVCEVVGPGGAVVGGPPVGGATGFPRLSVGGLVWKLNTPASPAIVAATTTPARFMLVVPSPAAVGLALVQTVGREPYGTVKRSSDAHGYQRGQKKGAHFT